MLTSQYNADTHFPDTGSAVTLGRCGAIRHVSVGSEIGSMADWISVAVILGTKLPPVPLKSPAVPFIVIPTEAGRTLSWVLLDSMVD